MFLRVLKDNRSDDEGSEDEGEGRVFQFLFMLSIIGVIWYVDEYGDVNGVWSALANP